MRRISRLDSSIGALGAARSHASAYTCSACRRAFATTPVRAEDSKTKGSEKWRQRIWGSEKPPGLKDPYSDASVLGQQQEVAVTAADGDAKSTRQKRKKLVDPNYVPAETMEGLEWVGGFGGWWKNNWDPEHQFAGFLRKDRVQEQNEATALLRRAVVEVVALQTAGKQGKFAEFEVDTADVKLVVEGDKIGLAFEDGKTVEGLVEELLAKDETAVKENPTEAEADVAADRSSEDPLKLLEEKITDETAVKEAPTESEEDVAADRSEEDPLAGHKAQDYAAQVASWDPSWLQISLANPAFKFAVVKRTMQLTGVRLADADIQIIKTVADIQSRLIAAPKPRKVTEALAQSDKYDDVPNVRIYDRRVTPIDEEKAVGRWKLIEQELKKRDLPVTGRTV